MFSYLIFFKGCDWLLNPTSVQEFNLTDLEGKIHRVAQTKEHKVFVFHLFASWCESCMQELPGFLGFVNSLPEDKFRIFLVAVKDRRSHVQNLKVRYNISHTIFLDALGRTLVIFGSSGVPFTAFTNHNLRFISLTDPANMSLKSLKFYGPRDWLSEVWRSVFLQEIANHFLQLNAHP